MHLAAAGHTIPSVQLGNQAIVRLDVYSQLCLLIPMQLVTVYNPVRLVLRKRGGTKPSLFFPFFSHVWSLLGDCFSSFAMRSHWHEGVRLGWPSITYVYMG
jgi:hypothetical protein